jgi:hypothetical protein
MAIATITSGAARAATLHVAPGGTGTGTAASPFGRIQDGIRAAQPGDVVSVAAGSYKESLRTVRAGTPSARITVRADSNRGSVIVTYTGRVLTAAHAYVTVEGLVLDGNYGGDDAVVVSSAATAFILRNSEVRRSSYDGVDLRAPSDVLIEDSLIHHTLNAAGGRTDAHGIVAGAVRRLTIRRTEIHTFSGDALQVDPNRAAPGWSDVVIDGCNLWLAPLPSNQNGFAAGTVPGENAVDTKADGGLPRARITIRNTNAWGFRNGLVSNMAAFNLKENVDAVVDGVTVWDSSIAFRVRGGSAASPGVWARVQNTVVYNTASAFRYEDDVQNLRVWNVTVGSGVTLAFQPENSSAAGVDVRNLLVFGTVLAREAASSSNLAVGAGAFVDAARHNYQLAAGSPAIDAGVTISQVTRDRRETTRPQGPGYDVGAFERVAATDKPGEDEIVLYAGRAPVVVGDWSVTPDATAAYGLAMVNPNRGAARLGDPLAAPDSYFEHTFYAEAGRAYRLWLRGKAERDKPANDSVFVQFSGAIDTRSAPAYRIGTTFALTVSVAECGTCGLSGWGWQDTKSGVNVLGPVVYFGESGLQTLRIQPREDGLSLDQIVLSPADYLSSSPGATKDDETILPESNGAF